MNRKILFPLFLACLVALSGCIVAGRQVVRGSGKVASETRPVTGITGVGNGTIGELTITLGDQETLSVEAEDNLLPYLETTVTNGTLNLGYTPEIDLRPTRPIRYRLTVKSLQSLANSSTGKILAPKMTGPSVTITLSSTGDITVAEVQADTLTVNGSSSGSITISGGQAGRQVINLSSSGPYQAPNVSSQTALANLSSSGSATLWVTGQLDANLSSSGSVHVYGSPRITQHTSSSGKVIDKGSK